MERTHEEAPESRYCELKLTFTFSPAVAFPPVVELAGWVPRDFWLENWEKQAESCGFVSYAVYRK
jgi:hypothetical protein